MIKDTPEGALLTVYVQPNAGRTEYVGKHGDALKFRVAAPPVESAANEALCLFLRKLFDLPKRAAVIHAGARARRKHVLLKGVSSRRVWEVLESRPTAKE